LLTIDTASAPADVIRPYGTTPPSVFAMASAGLDGGSGMSLSTYSNEVLGPGNAPVDTGLGVRSASTSWSDASGDWAVSHARASFGAIQLFSEFADVTPSDFHSAPGAVADAGWVDTYTISHPILNGSSGTLTFGLHVEGEAFGGGNAGYGLIVVGGTAQTRLGQFQDVVWADGRLVPDDAYEPVSHEALFDVPFTFGVPFEMQIRAYARSGLSARPVALSSSGKSDFADEIYWTGIRSVAVGGNAIDGFQITSASGTDYSQSVPPTPLLPGDIDLDDDVDVRDAALLTPHLGRSNSSWSTGDFNGDHLTTLADLALQQANFGTTQASPAAPFAAVPEPSTGMIATALIAPMLLAFARRRR
jgi:hypothetical protein